MILGCVPSYMSYQDSSSALTVSSRLLSYLYVRLPRFLPHGLMSREARHLGPLVVRHDSLKPIQDGSRDIVFQGQAVYIPLEASVSRIPVLGNLVCEGLNKQLYATDPDNQNGPKMVYGLGSMVLGFASIGWSACHNLPSSKSHL